MSKIGKISLSAAALALLAACGGNYEVVASAPSSGPTPPAIPAPSTVRLSADFNQGIDGWKGDSADYSAEDKPEDVIFEQRALEAPLAGKGLYVAGHNRSDDMFLYVKKQFGGFEPSTSYKVSFTVQFATNTASGCVGVGGAPGEAVYVIGGAAPAEPKTVLNKDGRNEVNLDKGNQAQSGKAAHVLGHIGNSTPACGATQYQSKTVKSAEPLTVQSDADGKMWVLVGIDSGFEAGSKLSFQSVAVTAEPVAK